MKAEARHFLSNVQRVKSYIGRVVSSDEGKRNELIISVVLRIDTCISLG